MALFVVIRLPFSLILLKISLSIENHEDFDTIIDPSGVLRMPSEGPILRYGQPGGNLSYLTAVDWAQCIVDWYWR